MEVRSCRCRWRISIRRLWVIEMSPYYIGAVVLFGILFGIALWNFFHVSSIKYIENFEGRNSPGEKKL